MSDFFIQIFRFFRTRRLVFYLFLAAVSISIIFFASQIGFKEDISQTAGGKDDHDLAGNVVEKLNISDKIIVDITLSDSLAKENPGGLKSFGQKFVDSLNADFDTSQIRNITFTLSDTLMAAMMDLVNRHLPVFLNEPDYQTLDSLILPASIDLALEKNYKILVSPASMVLKKRIQQDPLGISNCAFAGLKSLNAGENFNIYDGCVYTTDLRHLLIFIVPSYPSSETSRNDKLIRGLDEIIKGLAAGQDSQFKVQYFGGTAVAVCNARQLKKDITLTLAIAIILIFLLVGWYFKSLRVPLLGLLPALFGGALALAVLSVTKGDISAISLGIGSVILGLIVDYALYLVSHFRLKQIIELTLKEMSLTIVVCSLTSAGAFLCLTFLNSVVLQDLGWFAALSVIGAAMFTLLILPHFLTRNMVPEKQIQRITFIDRLAAIRYEEKRWLVIGLIIIGVLSIWFANRVEFEKDMASLNFLTPQLARAESDLDKISNYKLKNLYLVSTGKTIEEALRNQEKLASRMQRLLKAGTIRSISGAGSLLTSDSLQQIKIDRWNQYWTTEKKQQLKEYLITKSQSYGFRPSAFNSFFAMLDAKYTRLATSELNIRNNPMVADWLITYPDLALAPTILKVSENNKALVYSEFSKNSSYVLFDKQTITLRFIENVRHDFNLLVTLSMIFVTSLLIFSFGRLGLGLITALPMFFSWLITLGFMGLTGIRFNIFNIIISSFIFGLGVDYSILMMRGLQQNLKSGKNDLHAVKVSVLLSSLTTLFGVGALFFARHPALQSIAMVSVVGIIAVVILSFVFIPLIFNGLILNRERNHKFPVTFRVLIKTIVTWGNIVLIAVVLMVLGSLIKILLPVKREKKEILFHHLFYWLTRVYIAFTFAFDRKLINETGENFSRPAIIISNHQSLIETPAFLRLYPKIIILTTTWVHQSPIFGPIARLANFFNVDNGIENILDLL
ncbi:MAG: MMPL family transporter, partial [Bacteroidetes bacterium]|nr:MMPL family transporter [Bacteroidota bacterium]